MAGMDHIPIHAALAGHAVLAAHVGLAVLALAPAPSQESPVQTFDEYGLTLTLPAEFTDLTKAPTGNEQLKGRWKAKLGESALEIDLYVLDSEQFGFAEPGDVTEIALRNVRDPKRGDPLFWFEKTELVQGAFGWASFGSIGWGDLHDKSGEKVVGSLYLLGGLLQKHGYSVEVNAEPKLADDQAKVVLEFLRKGVAYKGVARDPKWTDAEARERWMRDAPKETHAKFEKPLRTAHYLILTNSSGGKKFAEAMEKSYTTIKKTYPFDDAPGQRLMPVFLFRTPEQYYDYYAKIANTSIEAAKRSKGHAWRDYYATWYEAPNDPVHIHEATHQIFKNRMYLFGGGSWFQEGVAEYIETSDNERNAIATQVKKGRYTPLTEFVQIESLLQSANEDDPKGDASGDHYKQAALLIEFLRESKLGKDKFPEFLRSMGRVPYGSLKAIDRTVSSIYGVDLVGLDAQFVEYCKKR